MTRTVNKLVTVGMLMQIYSMMAATFVLLHATNGSVFKIKNTRADVVKEFC